VFPGWVIGPEVIDKVIGLPNLSTFFLLEFVSYDMLRWMWGSFYCISDMSSRTFTGSAFLLLIIIKL